MSFQKNPNSRYVQVIGEAIIISEPRFCACGCGEELPKNASARRAFINTTHRSRAHRKGRKITGTRAITSHAKSIRSAMAVEQIAKLGEAAASGDAHAMDDLHEIETALDAAAHNIKRRNS